MRYHTCQRESQAIRKHEVNAQPEDAISGIPEDEFADVQDAQVRKSSISFHVHISKICP